MAIKTKLIWDGKYDANGKKVAPSRIALPFQTIETVNESNQDRQLNLFQAASKAQPWRNRLIWGDKKYVLPSLLPEFAGEVDLIYIDPPFDTGADFSFTATVPASLDEEPIAFEKQPSILEQKAYRDTWGRGMDSFLQWLFDTIDALYELLSEQGSIYVHLDSRSTHYAKLILDEIFGVDRFMNEIIWKRTSARNDAEGWGAIHDTMLFYSKTKKYIWNKVFQEYDNVYLEAKYSNADEKGRYSLDNLTAAGLRNGHSGKPWNGFNPADIGRHWNINREAIESIISVDRAAALTTQEKLELLNEHNYIYWPKGKGGEAGFPRFKRYLGKGVVIQDIISDIPPVNSQAAERLTYPTQKPMALLERVIQASSNPDSIVLDCFVGSGTTAASAEKLNRRWIACDLGRFAIHTTRKRLLSIPEVRPFIVQNLGKYERQAWQAGAFEAGSETAEAAARRHRAYVDFIVGLYHASPLSGHAWLHGVKKGRMIHVGAVDAPVTTSDVRQIATEFRRVVGSGKDAPTTNGVDVLGWDFAFEINEVAKQQAIDANIQMLFKKIPRDVMDKRAVEQGDIHFFELAALAVDAKAKGRDVTLTLSNFVIHPDDVPADVMAKVTHWSQWIDYWAVDWDHKGDTFHNQWQAFRTRREPKLTPSATHRYDEPGEYRVVVKVIDILGNDTTKTLKVAVAK